MAKVTRIPADELDGNTPQTPGLSRFEAVSARSADASEIWMGRAELDPGGRTGVHHHGDSETAVYVLSGTGRWWVGDNLDELVEANAGDFVFIPPYVVHREENPSNTERAVMIVARSTQEPIVVNLDG
jgi:uncharacterized RmlC-like cupin family protein